jgi:hypothetical protein
VIMRSEGSMSSVLAQDSGQFSALLHCKEGVEIGLPKPSWGLVRTPTHEMGDTLASSPV